MWSAECCCIECLENRQITASCVQAKHRSEIPLWPHFPCAEKIPVQLCPDSPRGPQSNEYASQNFQLSCDDEIKLHTTINFEVDSSDVGSDWFNDTMFRRLIKLNKYSYEDIYVYNLYAALLN